MLRDVRTAHGPGMKGHDIGVRERLQSPTFLRRSGIEAGGLVLLGRYLLALVRGGRGRPLSGAAVPDAKKHLPPTVGRLHRQGRGLKWRVDRPRAPPEG